MTVTFTGTVVINKQH